MKTFKKLMETVNPPKSPDERDFVHTHEVEVYRNPAVKGHFFSDQVMKDRSRHEADLDQWEDELVYEEILTPEQEKKKEEIVLTMKDKKKELMDKYGDEWKSVMYATATKMAKKESYEPFKAGAITLLDQSTYLLSEEDSNRLNLIYNMLDHDAQGIMEATFYRNKYDFHKMLKFSKEVL